MSIAIRVLRDVPAKWHDAFVQFVETGDIAPGFDEALEKDPDVQRAVDHAFRMQTESAKLVAEALKGETVRAPTRAGSGDTVEAFVALILTMGDFLPDERREFVKSVMKRLEGRLTSEQRGDLSEMLMRLFPPAPTYARLRDPEPTAAY